MKANDLNSITCRNIDISSACFRHLAFERRIKLADQGTHYN